MEIPLSLGDEVARSRNGREYRLTRLFSSGEEDAGVSETIASFSKWLDRPGEIVLLDHARSLTEARAAVLAARGRAVFVAFDCGEKGLMSSGDDTLPALVTLQSMGACAVGIRCPAGKLAENIGRLTPFARIPLIALSGDGTAAPDALFALGARVFGPDCDLSGLPEEPFARKEEDPEAIICAGRRALRFIEPTIDVGQVISCSPGLAQDILAAEEQPTGAIKIEVSSEDDLAMFEQAQYMIDEALCIVSDSREIFEAALRVFDGRAFYDGTCDFEDDFLNLMSERYGLICL